MGWDVSNIRVQDTPILKGNILVGSYPVYQVLLGEKLIWPIPIISTSTIQYPWQISIDYRLARQIPNLSFTVTWSNGHSFTFTGSGSEEIHSGWSNLVYTYYGDDEWQEPYWSHTFQWYYWPESNSVTSVRGSNGNSFGAQVSSHDTGLMGSMDIVREYTVEVY